MNIPTDYFAKNAVCRLLGIAYPTVQGGMVWVSGHKLVCAVSNAGGLGLLGSGSMYPEMLAYHINKCQENTQKPFGVNIPLLYPDIESLIKVVVDSKIKIVFTSAGNPNTWTSFLKSKGIKVVHVVSSLKFALKAQQAGVDAIVAEGFEAGGHNGREENSTFTLIPLLKKYISIPIIAAGGIAKGESILAAQILGAAAAQIGSLFVTSEESSAHEICKKQIIESNEGDTVLTLKSLAPIRILKTKIFEKIALFEKNKTPEELKKFIGTGRLKKGIFQGDLDEGIIEIGQACSMIEKINPAQKIIKTLLKEYFQALQNTKPL